MSEDEDSEVIAPLISSVDSLLAAYRSAEPLAESVYHYTSLDAAVKIITTSDLWVSNVRYSNDPSEGEYGLQVIVDVLKRDAHFALTGLMQVISDLDCYATSFSADPDLLTQWRAYCRNGRGVAIGVHTDVLAQIPKLIFMRVEYDRSKQEQLIRDILNVFRHPIIGARGNNQRLQPLIETLGLYFVIVRAVFKSPAYFSEREYRLFNTLPKPWPAHQKQLEFRVTPASIIPYFRANLTHSKSLQASSPLSDICIGPCIDHQAVSASLQIVADQHGMPIQFTRSRVRMRCD